MIGSNSGFGRPCRRVDPRKPGDLTVAAESEKGPIGGGAGDSAKWEAEADNASDAVCHDANHDGQHNLCLGIETAEFTNIHNAFAP